MTVGIVDTVNSAGEELIQLFQEYIESFNIPEGAKVVLRTLNLSLY